MPIRALPLLPVLALAGCVAATGAPEPASARLSADGLSVRFANGMTCRGGTPPEGARRWSGALGGCPEGWRYVVELDSGANPARFIVEAAFEALTIEDALAPFATVTVVDPASQATVFVSPPSRAG